jgi:hypothetical protein
MSLSTMYIIAVSIVPAALGVLLLTLVCIDALSRKAGRSQQSTADQQLVRYQPYLATGGKPELAGFGSLFHRGATE